jgi:GNAT superfamily N-acetyltransferase
MLIERYSHGPRPVYERAAAKGRMLPPGLRYIDSWVVDDGNLDRCFQLMETDDPSLFDEWSEHWRDLGSIEVFPVVDSKTAAASVGIIFEPPPLVVRPFDPERDEAWVRELCHGETRMARKGELLDVLDQEVLIAERNGTQAGALAYRRDRDDSCELFFIAADEQWTGAGSALVEELVRIVGPGRRVWVVTTNDNLDAVRFYQRRGFRLRDIRPGAVDAARRALKPGIPEIGNHGIAIRDEIELELTT